MNGDEIVRYIVTETLAATAGGQASASAADQLVMRFLREFGGQQVYLPLTDRRLVIRTQARIFAVAQSSTQPADVVAKSEGISRATLYRLLKRGPPSEP